MMLIWVMVVEMSLGAMNQLFWKVQQFDLANFVLDFDLDSLDIVDLAVV